MATQITNSATLSYSSDGNTMTVSSNIASATLNGPMTASKCSLDDSYRFLEDIVYDIFVTNTGSTPLTNIKIVDNLGTYALANGTNVTPLDYVGENRLFIDNVPQSTVITPTVAPAGDSITFTIPNLAAGSTMMLQFITKTTAYAPFGQADSSITNKFSVTADTVTQPVTGSYTIDASQYADVSITKEMTPKNLVSGSPINYTFEISNYGNASAENIVLRDAFSPEPIITSVTVNNTPVASTEYSYLDGVFLYPSTTATATTFSLAPAGFVQNPVTGETSVTPTTTTIVITGTI